MDTIKFHTFLTKPPFIHTIGELLHHWIAAVTQIIQETELTELHRLTPTQKFRSHAAMTYVQIQTKLNLCTKYVPQTWYTYLTSA